MPRPKRVRQAPQAAANYDETEEQQQTRGRSRRTRFMGARTSVGESAAIDAANRTRDAAIERLANEDATTTGDETIEPAEVGRRATTPQRRDTTGLDLGDSIFGDLDDSFELGIAPSSIRSGDNSSIYGSSHIKPRSRSRQSSIIGRNDPPIRPSSRGGNTPLMSSSLNIGAFRRRAREPSILGTDRKTRPDVTATTTQDNDSSSELEEDFAPEAESTPVNNRRRTRASLEQPRAETPELPELSGTRKRKSDGAPAASDRPEKATRTDEPEPETLSESESDLSSLPSPQAMPAHVERPVTPNQEEWAAPPASSGSEDEGDFWPDIHGLAKRRRRPSVPDPVQADALSDVSSPPSLTHSPNLGQGKASKGTGRSRIRMASPPPLMTADLATLLPKRRQKRRAEHDSVKEVEYDASGLAQDDDELSFLDARSARRKPKSTTATQPKAAHGGRASNAQSSKENLAPAQNTRSSSRLAKTYSRRSADKENESENEEDVEAEQSMFQPLEDETFGESNGDGPPQYTSAEELRSAIRKFAEVDRFELSFEEEEEPELAVAAR